MQGKARRIEKNIEVYPKNREALAFRGAKRNGQTAHTFPKQKMKCNQH